MKNTFFIFILFLLLPTVCVVADVMPYQNFKDHIILDLGVDITSADERFMEKLYTILEKNISNAEMSLDDFAQEIAMSRANLYRKIKSVTNLSPTEFIRNFRLEMATKLLKDSSLSVSDVYMAVGFNSHAYFSNCFRKLYGMSPSEFAAMHIKQSPI